MSHTVLVALRAGVHEIVEGAARWEITASESLELYDDADKLVATFRDWSFVKFMEPKK